MKFVRLPQKKTIFYFLFFLLFFSFPSFALAQCQPGKIDLLDYYLPKEKNTTVEIHHYSSAGTETGVTENFYTYPATVSNGKTGFYFVKSEDPKYFEEFAYDDNYIYHLKDTTWTQKCPGGDDAFYTLFDGNLGENACNLLNSDQEGAKWVKRCLAIGETSGPFASTIAGFSKKNCQCCLAPQASEEVKTLIYQGPYTFPNGWHSDDLIILEWPGGGEKYFVDRRYGMIAFEGAGFRSYPVLVKKSQRQVQFSCLQANVLSHPSDVKSEWEISSETEEQSSQATAATSRVRGWQDPVRTNNLGQVDFHQVNFPKLQSIASLLGRALKNLLPEKRSKNVQLPGESKLRLDTFVIPGKKEGDAWVWDDENISICTLDQNSQTAKEEVEIPAEWGQLAGANEGLSLLQPRKRVLTKTDSLSSFKYTLADEDFQCYLSGIGPGPTSKPQTLNEPVDIKKEFQVPNLFAYFKELIENIFGRFIKREKKIKVIPSGKLTAGSLTAENSTKLAGEFLSEKRMADFAPKSEGEVLQVSSQDKGILASTILSPEQEGGYPLFLGRQERTRNYDCLTICQAYPQKRTANMPTADFCPGCSPRDYQVYKEAKPAPSILPQYCNWDGYGCHYYDPYYCQHHPEIENCNEYVLCEDGRCLPGGLPEPGKFFCDKPDDPNCDISCLQLCHWEEFQPNPAGGFGPCYYQNPKVCLRNDKANGCAGICNAACCAYQR